MPTKNSVKSVPLSKAVEGFTLACQARRLSWHTISDYSNTLRIFIAHVGDIAIDNVQVEQVRAFLAAQKVSEKTTLNYHTGLSALWTWAIKEGYIHDHIMRRVEKPKPKRIKISPFTETEVRALFTGIRGCPERDRAMLLLLLDTGLRASELCNIQRADIDFNNRRIKVLGKGNKERELPMSSRTSAAIFRHLALTPQDQPPFNLSRTSLGHHIMRMGKRVGVPAHPHRFRHTFAITFLRNGGDPYTLQEILGHSTMDMVKEYLHLAQIDLDNAHRRASPVENWKL